MSEPEEFIEEEEIAVEPSDLPTYPNTQEIDEQRRAYVLECLTTCGDAPGIDGAVLVKNLDMITEWLKSGKIPAQAAKPKLVTQAKTV